MMPMICVGIGLQLAPHDLARERHGEREQFALHFGVELLEGLGEIVEHAGEPLDLRAHLGAARLASLGQSLFERLLIRLGLQIDQTAHRRHFVPGRGRAHVGRRPQLRGRRGRSWRSG